MRLNVTPPPPMNAADLEPFLRALAAARQALPEADPQADHRIQVRLLRLAATLQALDYEAQAIHRKLRSKAKP